MHYIRFLKPPRLLLGSRPLLGAKITVTTDLGETFLWEDVELVVELEFENGAVLGKGTEYLWKGRDGMRSLEVSIPLGKGSQPIKMLVRPKEQKYALDTFEDILNRNASEEGGIVAVRSTTISTTAPSATVGMAERVFTSGNKSIHISEETGESIARHIWYGSIPGTSHQSPLTTPRDAGLVLSSYLSTVTHPPPSKTALHLPELEKLLSKKGLNVLELGAGCGIVGLTLASSCPTATLTLTDLPEATSILCHNLALHQPAPRHPAPTHRVLDWSRPLPARVAAQTFDLVALADCTYNPDVVPHLVATLGRIGAESAGVAVLVAMKVRHESEMVFFELMRGAGWVVVEEGLVRVGVLGGEEERVEVFVFRLDIS
jgi:predicted nicotinamide N-methyase